MVNLKAEYQAFKQQIDLGLEEVLQSGYFIGGPKVTEFSEAFASFMEIDHVIPCANGTDALQIAFMALGLGEGDEVIIPAFTYVAPAEAALLLGCKPVFVDVDPFSYCIDVSKVEEKITSQTKCIVPVHLFGQSADMSALMSLAEKHQLFVVEDNAQATGARHMGKRTGCFGHIGTTSFFPSKNLGCYGDGGAIFTQDDQLAKSIKQIASHGQAGPKFYHDVVGINSRLDAVQAVILLEKLKHLDQALQNRKLRATRYSFEFQEVEEIIIPDVATNNIHTYHQYVILVPKEKRDALRAYLKENGIASGVYYPHILPDLPPYQSQDAFPVSSQLSESSLAIPIHPYLTDAEQEKICKTIKQFFHA